jgi:hypothetical protein
MHPVTLCVTPSEVERGASLAAFPRRSVGTIKLTRYSRNTAAAGFTTATQPGVSGTGSPRGSLTAPDDLAAGCAVLLRAMLAASQAIAEGRIAA